MVTGGGVKQTLKVVHWNKGSSWWENATSEVQALILQLDPDLLFIAEANMRTNIPDYQKQISGYYLINPNTSISMNYSRQVLY